MLLMIFGTCGPSSLVETNFITKSVQSPKIGSTPYVEMEGPHVPNIIKSMIFERFRKYRVGLKKN